MLKKSIHSVALNGLTYHDIFNGEHSFGNYNFNDGLNDWNATYANEYVQNGILVLENNSTYKYIRNTKTNQNVQIVGNKYYVNMRWKPSHGGIIPYYEDTSRIVNNGTDWQQNSVVFTAITTSYQAMYNTNISTGTHLVDYLMRVDLTELFGSGNEPTQEVMDALFAEFQEAGAVALGQFEQGQGKNLFDKSIYFLGNLDSVGNFNSGGATVSIDGAEITINSSATFRGLVTDFISVQENTPYTLSAELVSGSSINPYAPYTFFYYDSNYNFLSKESNFDIGAGQTSKTYTTPTNTKYIKFSIINATVTTSVIKNLQLEQGSGATDYEPYKYLSLHLPATNDVPVWTTNLFDKSAISFNSGSIDNSGNPFTSSTRVHTDFIPFNEGTYTFSIDSAFYYRNIAKYDSSFNFISFTTYQNTTENSVITETMPANTAYIRLNVAYQDNSNIQISDVDNAQIQLELGSVATTYRPYNLTLNEIFDEGNLVVNGDFSDGTTGWSQQGTTTFTVENSKANVITSSQFGGINQTIFNNNGLYYYRHTIKTTSTTIRTYAIGTNNANIILSTSDGSNITKIVKGFLNVTSFTLGKYSVEDATTSNFLPFILDDFYAINLTTLGIDNLTQAEMDALYERYTRNKERTLLANTLIQHDQNSVPIADLNGLTLDEVFVGGNVVVNGDFSNGTNAWASHNINDFTLSVVNEILNVTLLDNTQTISQAIFKQSSISSIVSGNLYYISFDMYPLQTGQVRMQLGGNSNNYYNITANTWNKVSKIVTTTSNDNILYLFTNVNLYSINDVIKFDNIKIIPLTSLGITADQQVLDYWFNVWQQNHKLGMRVHRASGNDVPVVQTKNLFDKNNVINGFYVRYQGGTLTALSNFNTSDFIPVVSGETYTFTDLNLNYAQYDSNFNYITTALETQVNRIYTATMSANTKYVRLSIHNDDLDTAQFELGSTATDYVPHKVTLNEVFRDGQLIPNGDFSNGTTGWTGESSTRSVVDGLITVTTTNQYSFYTLLNSTPFASTGKHYIVTNKNSSTHSVQFQYKYTGGVYSTLTADLQKGLTSFIVPSGEIERIRYFVSTSDVGSNFIIDYVYAYNLTALGLDSLTQSQLDYLFTVWQFNNANALVARQFIQTANIDTVAYGGLSYREIFEDGNLQTLSNFDNTENSNVIQYDNYYEVTSNGNPTYYTWRDSSFNYDTATYYYSTNVSSNDNIDVAFGLRFGNALRTYDFIGLDNDTITRGSGVTSGTASSFYMRYLSYDLNTSFKVYDIYILNLTDLFGAGNEPNQATMDTLYQEYITLKGGLS